MLIIVYHGRPPVHLVPREWQFRHHPPRLVGGRPGIVHRQLCRLWNYVPIRSGLNDVGMSLGTCRKKP